MSGRPLGYRRVYSRRTGKPEGFEVEPAEAREIREVFRLTAAGMSTRQVGEVMRRDFERRWTERQVGRVLHRDQYVREDGPRIIEPELWERAHRELAKRRPKRERA
jgi:hypothetical protein